MWFTWVMDANAIALQIAQDLDAHRRNGGSVIGFIAAHPLFPALVKQVGHSAGVIVADAYRRVVAG